MKLVLRILAFTSVNLGRSTICASPVPSSAVAWGGSYGNTTGVDLTNVADISCTSLACLYAKTSYPHDPQHSSHRFSDPWSAT